MSITDNLTFVNSFVLNWNQTTIIEHLEWLLHPKSFSTLIDSTDELYQNIVFAIFPTTTKWLQLTIKQGIRLWYKRKVAIVQVFSAGVSLRNVLDYCGVLKSILLKIFLCSWNNTFTHSSSLSAATMTMCLFLVEKTLHLSNH